MLGTLGAVAPLFGGSGGGDQAQDQQSGSTSGPAQGGTINSGPVRSSIRTGASTGIPTWAVAATLIVGGVTAAIIISRRA